MQTYQREFIQFCIDSEVICFGDFTLKSGRKSPYFFNAGLFNTGKKLHALGHFYAEAIQEVGLDFDIIYGPAYKGIPLATSTAIALSEKHDIDKPYCFNRAIAKDHGEKGKIVGATLKGKVLMVDDVITAGTTVRETLEILKPYDAELTGILIALNRQEKNPDGKTAVNEVEDKYHTKVISIIKLDDLIEFLEETKKFPEYLDAIKEYRKEWGEQ